MEEVLEGACDSVVAGAIEVAGGMEVDGLRARGVLSATMNYAKGGRGSLGLKGLIRFVGIEDFIGLAELLGFVGLRGAPF
ncbi:hypothetical protein GOBAR_DD15312 [Gossypium barbadense]|nr:hypothetical protein GOBAR_DD15312 [Gossypium barbadense]